MSQSCKNCGNSFGIDEDDRAYYAKMKVPEPTHCPPCRTQRRFAVRNERALYPDECDMCGKKNISIYSPDKPFTVYCYDCWLSDKWDRMDYGRNYDFNRPFFEQFRDLMEAIPRANLYEMFNENCDFTNYVGYSKNSYLVFGSIYVEDCMYGTPYESKNCTDSFLVRESELCYECLDCEKLYGCIFCQECGDSYDLAFCYDCRGCKNCIGCSGLRNKEFCIFNQQYTKEEYKEKKAQYDFSSRSNLDSFKKQFEEFSLQFPRKAAVQTKSENCTGNFVVESKDCKSCFDIKRCRDCSYCTQPMDAKDCMDCDYCEQPELTYEEIGYAMNNMVMFSNTVGKSYEVYYSDFCTSCKYCFGCNGLQHKEYCILNKQYTKEEYEELLPKIVEHMKKTGEWGEFFPIEISPFAYNETVAQEYFPMSEAEVKAKGWQWKEKDMQEYKPQTCEAPDKIADTDDSICRETLACVVTGKNFRIIPQELEFYRKMNLPVPVRCPDQRHVDRLAKRPARSLWDRACDKCSNMIKTAYKPGRPEKIYCEECYLAEVY